MEVMARVTNISCIPQVRLKCMPGFILRKKVAVLWYVNKFLVSKETVVLRRWERSKQKFGFIKRVDKGEITTVKDLES